MIASAICGITVADSNGEACPTTPKDVPDPGSQATLSPDMARSLALFDPEHHGPGSVIDLRDPPFLVPASFIPYSANFQRAAKAPRLTEECCGTQGLGNCIFADTLGSVETPEVANAPRLAEAKIISRRHLWNYSC